MQTSHIDNRLIQILAQHQPAALAAGSFLPQQGLSGQTLIVGEGHAKAVARAEPHLSMPWVSRRREYAILKQLQGQGLGPTPVVWASPWLVVEHLPGNALSAAETGEHIAEVADLLARLHHQPLCGQRISMTDLLAQYWQRCQTHSPQWLRRWRRLQRQGEPKPLRLALLHMDVHGGNVIATAQGLRLIDWEYAGDGDIALELAAASLMTPLRPAQQQRLIERYAQCCALSPERLARQVQRWKPWLRLLMACWYQLRAEQTQDAELQALAARAWLSRSD
ncbi:thiamine kinase [Enterobacterales bacterium CwR94]|nr:thiamine kinase [Enterobacterales bacterium CwR94]